MTIYEYINIIGDLMDKASNDLKADEFNHLLDLITDLAENYR